MKIKKLLIVSLMLIFTLILTGCSALMDTAGEIKELAELDEKYLNMSSEELCALDDSSLCYAVSLRTFEKIKDFENIEKEMSNLNKDEQTFYILDNLLMEVGNGGICQFFGNSSGFVAPLVSDSLSTIKADYHKELYDSFVKDNGIDFNNLQKFSYESEEQYDALYEQYPFDEFDEAFYAEVGSFEKHLAAFIRDNINSFA